jgi:MoaA/NifB/PqqE/SkfB family radical SAM enzyme
VQRPELPPGDAFDAVQRVAAQYPRCTLPFKELTVTWTGDVPLCQFSAAQLGEPGLLLGNLRDVSLAELWQGRLIRDYRVAHRRRDEKSMPMCRGCASV